MTTTVTSGRHSADSAVLDDRRGGRGSAATCGDVAGTDKVAVPKVATVATCEATSFGLWGSAGALRTGRRCPALIETDHLDAGHLGLVA
jgi:hypothetical protein